MFPCFLGILRSLLFAKASKARIRAGRVSAGSITESTVPYDAATERLGNYSVNLSTSCFFNAAGSFAESSSFLFIIRTAASEPSTAICAVGHA